MILPQGSKAQPNFKIGVFYRIIIGELLIAHFVRVISSQSVSISSELCSSDQEARPVSCSPLLNSRQRVIHPSILHIYCFFFVILGNQRKKKNRGG
ncbi:hypothetical protein BY996DRAFT_7121283 [Phakopsora pachyrhizi]|nr:hypothetical protein BY996DRAFT_7121283 [Phakopsora pachyrhizi]